MSNYIQGLLSKLRSNVFQMEIEAYEPEEWSQNKIDEFTAFSSQVRSNNFDKYFSLL